MHTSDEIYHRVLWDPRFDPERFVMGIAERGAPPKRVLLGDFVPGGEIPWHRVVFFEADGQVVLEQRLGETLHHEPDRVAARPLPPRTARAGAILRNLVAAARASARALRAYTVVQPFEVRCRRPAALHAARRTQPAEALVAQTGCPGSLLAAAAQVCLAVVTVCAFVAAEIFEHCGCSYQVWAMSTNRE
ncbi:DUF504 domain-containing protein [Streptomyces gardneri]|uniref:DUF504 domain-containing protein n=1 Tax=Streptomyces gardneri TaxID=66892 RepID=UPI0035DB6CC0